MYNITHDTCISYPNTKLYMIHLTGTKLVFVLPSNTHYTNMFSYAIYVAHTGYILSDE